MPLSPPGPTVERFRRALAALMPNQDLDRTELGVAVSGGPDSVALLLLAAAALPGRVRAATVDHRFRAESAGEAAEVAALCGTLGVPHDILTLAWTAPAANRQALAREARYAALARWATGHRLGLIATGHQLDDQAETLVLRLNRGAGVGGLAGVRGRRRLDEEGLVTLVRPLLGWRRAELAAIPAALGVGVVSDPANDDPAHDRTAVRALLHDLDGRIDPARLAASAGHLADAEEALSWTVTQLATARLTPADDGLALDVADLPDELCRRLVSRAIAKLAVPEPPPRGETLTRALRQLHAGAVTTLGGVVIRPAGGRWQIRRAPPRSA